MMGPNMEEEGEAKPAEETKFVSPHLSGAPANRPISRHSSMDRGSGSLAETGSATSSMRLKGTAMKRRQPAPLRQEDTLAESSSALDQAELLTMHGCACKKAWSVGGRSFKGCARAGWNSSRPFCYLEGACATKEDPRGFISDPFGLPGKTGDKWDYCPMPDDVASYYTHQGCHCLPTWDFENRSSTRVDRDN